MPVLHHYLYSCWMAANREFGCLGGTRTHNPPVNSRMLYRLSYKAIFTLPNIQSCESQVSIYLLGKARCKVRKVSVLQTVSFHYTSSPVCITDGVISLMTISPSLSSSFFILHIYYIIFFIKNQKRFFNGDRVGFDTNIIHRFFTLTKNYFSDLIPPRTTAVVFIKRPTK